MDAAIHEILKHNIDGPALLALTDKNVKAWSSQIKQKHIDLISRSVEMLNRIEKGTSAGNLQPRIQR